MTQPNHTCKNCAYYQSQDSKPEVDEPTYRGTCHRFPPIAQEALAGESGFPEVYENDWCGEFRSN